MAEEATISGLQKLRNARAARESSSLPARSSGNLPGCGRGVLRGGSSREANLRPSLCSPNSTSLIDESLAGYTPVSGIISSADSVTDAESSSVDIGCKDGTPKPSSDDRVPAIPPAISKEQKRTETELSLKKVFGHVEDEQESGRSLSGLTGEWTPLPLFLGPLKDAVTMKSYITYFSAHKTEFCGKIVLDVGCKLGLMSLICAGLGAKTVFAMDSSPFSSITMAVALDSGFPNIIPVRSTPEACANLPDNVSEVDVIVSDWIGVGFFRSNLLLQVITARDKFMKFPKIFPGCVRLFICGISTDTHHAARYWKQASSIDFSLLRSLDLTSPVYGDHVEAESICTTTGALQVYNLENLKTKEIGFTQEFCLHALAKLGKQEIPLTGLVVYFEIPDGEDSSEIVLTTDPRSNKITRFGQTTFCFPKPPIIDSKAEINGRFTYCPDLAGGTDPSFVLEYAIDDNAPLVEYYATDLKVTAESRENTRGA